VWLQTLFACGAASAPVTPEVAQRWEGTWTGRLDSGGPGLRLVVHLEESGGVLTGTLDSPDQGANGIPIGSVTATVDEIRFTVPSVGGRYSGAWADPVLKGTWSQGFSSLPLTLARGETAPPPAARPQDPVGTLPYDQRELAVPSAPGVTLAGTWTTPRGAGPWPSVVLVSGSGPQDRDESLMGHRPFLVLADALARAGVASYRFDDRGTNRSTGDFASATTADFVVDASAAVRAVEALPESGPVGVLGHSEGGYVAARLAARGPAQPAFVVLLAGPGITGRALLETQVEALNLAAGGTPQQAAQAREVQRRILEPLARGGTEAELRAAMVAEGLPPELVAQSVPVMTTAWYRALVAWDPAPDLAKIRVPVLALLGERDTQVVPGENAAALRQALAGNPKATVTVHPGLNHLFQPAKTGAPTEYGTIETTIDPVVLEGVSAWIVAATGSP
jgi:hypothetical protein